MQVRWLLDLQGERMKIDLTKKPEGATHINPHSGVWVKCFGGNSGSYQYFQNGEWEMGFGCMSNSYLEIAQPEPWTGEGLPPVGTVCEFMKHNSPPAPEGKWTKGDIRYLSDCTVIIGGDGCEHVHHPRNCSFRTIRTPEQIAAEEREKAIEGMITDTNILTGIMSDRRIMAGQLYDAGYRKQVAP